MNLDPFIRAAHRARRRAKILDVVSSKWFALLVPSVVGEPIWDWAFNRYIIAKGEADWLMKDEIRRSGGTVFQSPTYRERDLS